MSPAAVRSRNWEESQGTVNLYVVRDEDELLRISRQQVFQTETDQSLQAIVDKECIPTKGLDHYLLFTHGSVAFMEQFADVHEGERDQQHNWLKIVYGPGHCRTPLRSHTHQEDYERRQTASSFVADDYLARLGVEMVRYREKLQESTAGFNGQFNIFTTAKFADGFERKLRSLDYEVNVHKPALPSNS